MKAINLRQLRRNLGIRRQEQVASLYPMDIKVYIAIENGDIGIDRPTYNKLMDCMKKASPNKQNQEVAA